MGGSFSERSHVVLLLITIHLKLVSSSIGDGSRIYQTCLHQSMQLKCHTEEELEEFTNKQSLMEKLLWWDCEDDCRYQCMWKSVGEFKSAGLAIPQFHGKWPFIRIFGVQEPASMIFSLLNLYTHVLGIRLYMSQVDRDTPLYYPSILFSMVSMHAWSWSAIFHTRDFPFTEKMDYFSATAGVIYSIYYCVFRMSLGLFTPTLQRGKVIRKVAAISLMCLYIWHVSRLVTFFDYGYNMFVNVVAGLLNGTLWILYHILTRRKYSHQWMATCAVVGTVGLLSLELFDFAPVLWIFDAHSLWHLGTVLFPFLWYPFMVKESQLCYASLKTAE